MLAANKQEKTRVAYSFFVVVLFYKQKKTGHFCLAYNLATHEKNRTIK